MMNTLGYLWTEKKRDRWNKAVVDGYLSVAAVGVLSGVVVAYARTPIHLPGHKALWWMAPILAARLATRARAGASVGALAAALTTLSLGGRIAGGIVELPLVILAGIMLDLGVQFVERRDFQLWRRLLLLGLAGLVANGLCLVKRLFDPMGAFFSTGNMDDLLTAAGSYALFGFFAGLLGAGAGQALRILRRHQESRRIRPAIEKSEIA
jgi:hypothetical protein